MQPHEMADALEARSTQLIERLGREDDPAALRDTALAIVALGEGTRVLRERTEHERVSGATLRRWRDSVLAVLGAIAGAGPEDGVMRYGSYAGSFEEAVVDNGSGEPGVITSRMFWDLLEGTYREMCNLVGEPDEPWRASSTAPARSRCGRRWRRDRVHHHRAR
jgi:hypothetical protein